MCPVGQLGQIRIGWPVLTFAISATTTISLRHVQVAHYMPRPGFDAGETGCRRTSAAGNPCAVWQLLSASHRLNQSRRTLSRSARWAAIH